MKQKISLNNSDIEYRQLAARVLERFLIAPKPEKLLSGLDAIRVSIPIKYADIAAAFAKNLSTVISTVGMPFTLAYTAVTRSHWQRIYTSEKIRSLLLESDSRESKATYEVRRNQVAQKRASVKMRKFTSSNDGGNRIAIDTCQFLLNSLNSIEMCNAALELLLQGEVLTWSALEILARDLFELIVNADPKRVLTILQSPTAKQRLPSKFTLDELASFGFNVSNCLGSILTAQQNFSDLKTIKAVLLPVLNSETAVAKALGDRKLWLLCQRRHLIVHRRGIVDARYVEATQDTSPLGSQLSIAPSELESHIKAVGAAGTALLAAAGTHFA